MEDVNIQDSALELVNPFGRPIPGQSMTNDPDNPQPFEGPPEYSNHSEAIAWIVNQLFTEEMVLNVVDVLSNGLPVSELAYMILYEGFREGKWNPDLMMMLIEPLIYVLMALAEKADIEYRIDDEDDDEDDDSMLEEKARNIAAVAKEKMGDNGVIPASAVPSEIVSKIQEAEVPQGLLARPEQEKEEVAEQSSLLERGQ